jgi:hypothetical protein
MFLGLNIIEAIHLIEEQIVAFSTASACLT